MIGGLHVSCCEAVTADNMLVNNMNSKNQSSIIVQPFSRWLSRIGFRNSNRCATGIFIVFLLNLLFVSTSSNLLADESSTESVELVLTLNSAIELALERNRGLLNNRLDRKYDQFSLDIKQDEYRPEFTISSKAHRGRGVEGAADVGFNADLKIPTGGKFSLGATKPIDGLDSSGPNLTFNQPLLQGAGENIDQASLKQAHLEEKRKVLAFKNSVSGLVVGTIKAYRTLIQAFRELEISEASLQRARQQLDVSRALIQAGRIARREITRSEATVANRELALVRSRNNLDSANTGLIRTLDLDDLDSSTRIRPQEDLGVDQIRRVEFGEIDVHESIDIALSNSPDHLIQMLGVETAEINLRVAKNSELPNLMLTLNATRNRLKKRYDHSASLSLTIPLNDRSPKLVTMQAENSLIKARRSLEKFREEIGISVREKIKGVEVGYRVMELAGASRQLAEENLDIEQNKFSQGLSSTFEVSASEDALVDAQEAENNAIIGYLNALVDLDEVMGQTLETWGIEVEEVPQ